MLAALAIAALVMAGLAYREVLGQAEALFDYQLRQMALSLRDQGEIAPDQVGAFADEQLDFVIQIWSADGRSIYASKAHSDLPSRALLGLADMNVAGKAWRAYSVATRDRVIQVAQPLEIRRQLAADAALRSVAPLAWIAPLLALAGWWIVARTLAPLRRVAGDVRLRDERSLTPLPMTGLPDEVAPLVQSLNALLERLRQSLDAQRAFVSDAAHELRSPLTALKLQLRVLARAEEPAAREAAVDTLSRGIDRASRLVEQLLMLARSEPAATDVALAPVDLADIARQAIDATQAFAASRQTDLALDASEPVIVNADERALIALLRNLLDNAVRYAPAGARVQVGVRLEQTQPTLTVDDNGPGIAPAERERVFDRFYRGLRSDEEGTGLGLAIVRGVAQQHGAGVKLDTSPLGGLRVMVRFPAPSATG